MYIYNSDALLIGYLLVLRELRFKVLIWSTINITITAVWCKISVLESKPCHNLVSIPLSLPTPLHPSSPIHSLPPTEEAQALLLLFISSFCECTMTLPSAQDFPFSSPASKDGSDTSPKCRNVIKLRYKSSNNHKIKAFIQECKIVYYCIIDNVYFSSTCAVHM